MRPAGRGLVKRDFYKSKRLSWTLVVHKPWVGCIGDLPVDVLLGTDVPELTHLLGETALGKTQVNAMVVMTRARARQQREEESVIAEKEAESDWSTAKLSRVNWRRLRRRDDEPR